MLIHPGIGSWYHRHVHLNQWKDGKPATTAGNRGPTGWGAWPWGEAWDPQGQKGWRQSQTEGVWKSEDSAAAGK